jgi:hypothetical protein
MLQIISRVNIRNSQEEVYSQEGLQELQRGWPQCPSHKNLHDKSVAV